MTAAGAPEPGALSLLWGLPFAGLLLSLALLPLLAGRLWHRHDGKVVAFWALALVLPFALVFGPGAAVAAIRHVLVQDWLPFMALLLALYTTGGGVVLRGRLVGTPAVNTALLAAGTLAASVMGNTGGALTPLGDPPLYLGFLKGVGFFWTVQHLAAEFLLCAVLLLGLYWLL